MKKVAKILLVILILSMMLPTLAACRTFESLDTLREQRRAVELLNKLDDIIIEADSFTVVNETSVTGKSGDRYLTLTQTTDQQVMGRQSGESPAGLSKAVYDYDYQINSFDFQIALTQGYNDEYMFRNVLLEDTEIKIKSPVTDESIADFTSELLEETSLSSQYMTYTEEEDGSMTVTISRLDGATIERLGMSFGEITPGYIVTSGTITVTVSKDYSTWSSKVDYIFEEDENYILSGFYTPSAVSVTTFSNIDSTIVEQIDLEGYAECDDIGMIGRIGRDLMDKVFQPRTSAFVTINHFILHKYVSATLKETDSITCGTNDDGFYHEVTSKANNTEVDISYSGGVKAENDKTSHSLDGAERAFIYRLFTAGAFNELHVKSVKRSKSDPNTYTLNLYMNQDTIRSLTVGDTTFTYGYIDVIVTYDDDGFLSKIKTSATAWANYVEGGSSYSITCETMFFKVAE